MAEYRFTMASLVEPEHTAAPPIRPRKRRGSMAAGLCSVPGCTRSERTRGLCPMHYLRQLRNGAPGPATPLRGGNPAARFWTKVDKTATCWWWTGRTSKGYGMFSLDGGSVLAHRFAYEMSHGPLGRCDLDHLCRNPGCVNPAHLEPVTHRENVIRGVSPIARQAAQTHCRNGHPFDALNTYIVPSTGSRVCRACRIAYRQNFAERANRLRRQRRQSARG